MNELSKVDYWFFFSYLAVFITIAFWAGRKQNQNAADFFIQQNKLPWYVIGFSMIASGVSSEQFIGTVGFAYTHGLAVANWEWGNGPSILILIGLFIPFYLRNNIITMPHFLEKRFDGKVRTLFAVLTILIYIFINLAGVIYSGGYALSKIFNLNVYSGIWSITALVALFTIYGGMATIAWTNVFQACMLLLGGLVLSGLGILAISGGLPEIIGVGQRAHLILPANHSDIPWTSLLVLVFSTNVWYYCTNQNINQSTLGAKNEWHAKMGVIFAGLLWLIIPFADVFPGLIAYKLNPNLKNDEAYIYIIKTLLPQGAQGFMFVILCASVVSAMQAGINGVATIFTFDIYNRFINSKASQKKLILIGRIFTASVLTIGALWAPMVMKFGQIFSYFQECWAFVAIPVTVTFLAGVLWRRIHARSAFWTLFLVLPMLVMPYLLRVFQVAMNAFNAAGLVLIFTVIYMVALSYWLPARGTEDTKMVWTLKHFQKANAVFDSANIWALLMIAGYLIVYLRFW